MKTYNFIQLLLFFATIPILQAQNYQTIEEIDSSCAQLGFTSDEEAEIAVDRILEAVGLFRNFTIQECPDINNAVAKVIEISEGYKERYILYDNNFFNKINSKALTDWASLSILAHEIGHHLNGHSLNNEGSNHKFELEADFFSGSALAKLGASLAEAQSAITTLKYEKATRTHPAKADRLEAIKNGWNKANKTNKLIPKKITENKNNDNTESFEVFATNENLVVEYFKLATEAYNSKQYDVAASNFFKAFQYSNGKNFDYLYYVASCYAFNKDYNLALKYYLAILRTGISALDSEKQLEVYKNIGLIYLHQKRNNEALKFFDFALRNNPKEASILLARANLFFLSGDNNAYEAELKKITKLIPTNVNALYNLGVLSVEKGNTEQGIYYYEKVLNINPEHHNSLINISAAIISKELPIIKQMNSLGTTPEENKKYDALKQSRKKIHESALVYIEQYIALNLTNDNKNKDMLKTAADIYKTLGDTYNLERIKKLQNE